MKYQVVVIHGGNSFKTRKEYLSFLRSLRVDFGRYTRSESNWKKTLRGALGKRFEVILPDMPNRMNARYSEWKMWFEKLIPYLHSEVVLIGHSLGGVFLAKYLSEKKFPRKVRATFLIAPPSNADSFTSLKSLKELEEQGGKIFLYFSKDDPLVKFADYRKYQKKLKNATPRIFRDKGHFRQERFPELVKDIKNLYS